MMLLRKQGLGTLLFVDAVSQVLVVGMEPEVLLVLIGYLFELGRVIDSARWQVDRPFPDHQHPCVPVGVVMREEEEMQLLLFESVGVVDVLLAFGRDMRGDGLDLESFEVAGVEVVFFPEVGSEQVVVVGDHELVDMREADVESAVVHDLRGEMFKMVLDLISRPEVVRMIEPVEPLRIDLVKFLTLLQLLYLPRLHNADDLLMLVLPR